MSRFIAKSAIRGTSEIVNRFEKLYNNALKDPGGDHPIKFPNTVYYLPVIYGLLGHKVEKVSDLGAIVDHAKSLVPPPPADNLWLPYLGETLDAGMATLFAEEGIKGIQFAQGQQPEIRNGYRWNGPIDDVQVRSWGVAMVDGTMPGFAAILGPARNNKVAVKLVRELQSKGLLVFMAGNVNGRTLVDQLLEEGVKLGYDTYTIPLGSDTESIIYALGYATRAAISFGGYQPGDYRRNLLYNKFRCFAFALALGPVDDLKYATAAGALNYGFPVIADTLIPNVLPFGVTQYEHVVSMPFDDIPGRDDMERVERLVEKCIEVRGIKIKVAKVPIPVAYGPAFEGEVVRKNDLRVEMGGKGGTCFEWLRMKEIDEIEDGKFELIGPDLDTTDIRGKMPLGIVVDVAGRKMQKDFEGVLERQIHHFVNGAEGVQHQGQRDITWIRIHKNAVEKGFRIKDIGRILHANLHNHYGTIVDKVQVTFYTERDKVVELMAEARQVYRERNERIADLNDDSVDVYYSCTLCQSFAPTHVCVINPERVGLCGAYSWLDCKAAFEISPSGANQPITKGAALSKDKGEWQGVNDFVYQNSQRAIGRFTLYSLMDAPMTTCGCCECVMSIVPEANGVMVVSRDDYGKTPSGMTFTQLMAIIGGGHQTPGMMGHGKTYLTSKKFIAADGGIKRLVWLSKNLKEEFAQELKAACQAAGEPDLMDKICDGSIATDANGLMSFLERQGHPALSMDPMI
ncbi:MAG: acetyl-CoA decarbonylase/synthase complex subunit alpha/beta [Dehalococcoidia bacterium]|nr:acetyl-CoA decarbonylase/synthase complex subunit alpha/beta [Dehalococcoidia bacterium]